MKKTLLVLFLIQAAPLFAGELAGSSSVTVLETPGYVGVTSSSFSSLSGGYEAGAFNSRFIQKINGSDLLDSIGVNSGDLVSGSLSQMMDTNCKVLKLLAEKHENFNDLDGSYMRLSKSFNAAALYGMKNCILSEGALFL